MPLLADLRNTVAAYLGKISTDLTVNGVDLFLEAANNVRQEGELLHDFEQSKTTATLSVDVVAGGALSSATIVGNFVGIKEVITASVATALGYQRPIPYSRKDVAQALTFERDNMRDSELAYYYRYPSDQFFAALNAYHRGLVQQGSTVYFHPIAPTNQAGNAIIVYLDVYAFLPPFTAAAYAADDASVQNYFFQYGYSYLKWGIVCELNYLFQRFVSRQEGVLSPPEQNKATAWNKFVLWDSYSIDPNAQTVA